MCPKSSRRIPKFSNQSKKYKIELSEIDSTKKLNIIKELKNLLKLGLKESKEMVEKLPSLVGKDMSFDDMNELKEKLEAIGCKLNIN